MNESEIMYGDDMPIESNQPMPADTDVLAFELTKLLGTNVVFKFLAHGAHWNVKGKDFNQFHDFFGEIYEDAEAATDHIAELIRQLDYDAPFMLQDLVSLSSIQPEVTDSDCASLAAEIQRCNEVVIEDFKYAFNCANECNEQGIADFLAGQIDAHMKLQWKLRATLYSY